MKKKLYIAINRNYLRRSECMCRLGIQGKLSYSLSFVILWIKKDRALCGSKEGVNL